MFGKTNIFIRPGYKFKLVDGLITNFHLPKSTLFILISAFLGREKCLEIYQYAIKKRFRFFSYGDAMLAFRLSIDLVSRKVFLHDEKVFSLIAARISCMILR